MHQLSLRNKRLRFQTSGRILVTDAPDEFEKQPVKVLDFRKTTNHFRGNSRDSIQGNVGYLAILLGFASISWTKATSHSRMQSQMRI